MKNLIILVVIALAGLLAYNYFTTGKLQVIPSSAPSEEELSVQRLDKQFREAQRRFTEGGHGAAIGGIDTQADLTGAMREVERIEKALTALMAGLKTESAKTEAEKLLQDIRTFKQAHK